MKKLFTVVLTIAAAVVAAVYVLQRIPLPMAIREDFKIE